MKEKWVIAGVITLAIVQLIIVSVSFIFFVSLLSGSDTRGLRVTGIWRTNDAKFPSVENTGRKTVYFCGFHDENGNSIRMAKVDEQFWNGSCYALPSGKFVTLVLDGEQYYSKKIYVEFYDGEITKIYTDI